MKDKCMINKLMNGQMMHYEWMNEWMNEQMNKRTNEYQKQI